MNISILIQIENSILRKVLKSGIFPDSLENILVMRIYDLLRHNNILYSEVSSSVIREHGILYSLYQVSIIIRDIRYDAKRFGAHVSKYLCPYADQIRKVNMVIH